MSDNQFDDDALTRDDIEEEIKEPSMYKVVLINDDYTPMEVVTIILTEFFAKEESEANTIMLKVHKEGKGLAGVYTHDIAKTKQTQSMAFARKLGFPLRIELEEE